MLALRNALRSLRRSPGFATVSILSLAFALGLVTAVFGLVDSLRFPRTAIHKAEELFELRLSGEGAAGRLTAGDHIEVVERFLRGAGEIGYVAHAPGEMLMARDIRLSASGRIVSPNYFPLLGIRPIEGRVFGEATATDDAPASVVISERIWRQVFDADPRLERLAVTIESDDASRRLQVVGVVPQEFAAETRVNFWTVSDLRSGLAKERYLAPVIRVRPGITRDSLYAQFSVVTDYLTSVHGTGRRGFSYHAFPLKQDPLRIDDFAWLLVAAAFAVLVIACSNLANLILARGLARQAELAVRFALGARRSDIIKAVLAECLVVALAGAALGIVAAAWGFDLLRTYMPERAGGGGQVFILEMSWRVIAMSSSAAAIAGLVFGLLPALRLSDVNLAANIKEHSGTTTGRRGGRFPVLVIGQVALSLAMLTCVSLLLRAAQKAQALDFGFDPARLLSVDVVNRSPLDTSQTARLAIWSATEKRLRDLPGVEAVSWVSDVSLYRSANLTGERSDGATRTRNLSSYMFASANVLRTKGIQIIRGRDFLESDELGEGVVVIDSATALRIWGSEDPIGKLVKFAPEDRISPWFRVVGVSRSVLTSVPMYEGAETPSSVYMVGKEAFLSPLGSGRRPLRPGLPSRSFVVRGKAADIAALRNAIPAAIRDILPPRGLTFIQGFDDQRRDLIARQRFLAKVFGTFGVLSLALCALGLYSVLAYSVSRRSREHGIRVALGATRKHVFLDVLHEGAILVVAGTAVGGLATFWSNRLVDPYIGLLYHIDAPALVAAEAVLVGVALAAMVRPAMRAMKTDPVEVLRAV